MTRLLSHGVPAKSTAPRSPNSPIRDCGLSGPNEISLHPSSLKEPPVQAWFDETGRFIVLEYPSQRAQVWDAATGLPVTPTFQSRYATIEAEYRTFHLPKSPNPQSSIPNRPPIPAFRPLTSALRLQAELLAGGWKPLELGEIVARWSESRPSHGTARTPPNTHHPR
jgi:hypothetical protein